MVLPKYALYIKEIMLYKVQNKNCSIRHIYFHQGVICYYYMTKSTPLRWFLKGKMEVDTT